MLPSLEPIAVTESDPVAEVTTPSPGSLQYYMIKAYDSRPETLGQRPYFSRSVSAGKLDRNRVNRVLLFGGCFDPPHVAHLRLLEYVYSQTHARLNIVGAIIIPWSEHSCEKVATNRKNRATRNNKPLNEGHEIHFQLEERMRLWQQDPGFPDWASVMDVDIWDSFRDRLLEATKLDGYELKFMFLRGVDHVRPGAYVFHALGTDEMITSDVTRAAEFVTDDGLLTLSDVSTPWTIWVDRIGSQVAGSASADSNQASNPFYYCRVNPTQDLVLFVPKQGEGGKGGHFDISSTQVRKLMKEGQVDPQAITGELANLVLGPHRQALG